MTLNFTASRVARAFYLTKLIYPEHGIYRLRSVVDDVGFPHMVDEVNEARIGRFRAVCGYFRR
jgi:hypothetical protein